MSMTKTVKEVSAATPGSPLHGLCWCECRDRRILRKMIGRRRAGEERRREDGEGVRPGCWCEWGEGRKRGEKISIYGKKTEGSVIEGAFTLRELSSGARRGIRQLVIARPYPRISVCVCVCVCVLHLYTRRWGEEDTPKDRREDAVIRYLQGCREGETGESGRGRTALR